MKVTIEQLCLHLHSWSILEKPSFIAEESSSGPGCREEVQVFALVLLGLSEYLKKPTRSGVQEEQYRGAQDTQKV